MSADLLTELQQWYAANTDGDWEHDHGIQISTIDNPGWRLRIDVRETPIGGSTFDDVTIERDDKNWYRCWLREGVFEGAGGAENLSEMLSAFLQWVASRSAMSS